MTTLEEQIGTHRITRESRFYEFEGNEPRIGKLKGWIQVFTKPIEEYAVMFELQGIHVGGVTRLHRQMQRNEAYHRVRLRINFLDINSEESHKEGNINPDLDEKLSTYGRRVIDQYLVNGND
jgi:hypothetical protein